MKFLKEHVAPTMHNAIGGVITWTFILILGLFGLFFKNFRNFPVPGWCVILITLPIALGWFLFFPERRNRRMAEKELEAVKAHRFEDDYVVEPRSGASRHKSEPGYYCTSCVTKGISSRLKEMQHGWECQIKGCEKFYANPDYKPPPHKPIYVRNPFGRFPL
jgi:hypothetical protein